MAPKSKLSQNYCQETNVVLTFTVPVLRPLLILSIINNNMGREVICHRVRECMELAREDRDLDDPVQFSPADERRE